MKNLKGILTLLLVNAIFLACNKDDRVSYVPEYTVTFAGRIIDENGQAVEGAQVDAGNEQALTDKNGVFRLHPVLVEASNAILRVSKAGYFQFSRAYQVQDRSIQSVEIQLLQKQQVGDFNTASGGSVNLTGGARLNFPANGVIRKAGGAYNGQVLVYAHYLDPTSPDLLLNMPGDLRAFDAEGKEGVLSTFGMLAVEIESPSGEALQIASGAEAEISMPIPLEKSAVAPAVIALWYYDHDSARWIEEGSAQKTGNEYVGKVKHFSFWNCDAFSEVVNLSGKIFLENRGTPLSHVRIRLTVVSNGFTGYGVTNGDGWFGGAVPKDMEMILEVLGCGNTVLHTQTVGPFSANAVLPDIIIHQAGSSTSNVSGQILDCNGSAVQNGYAMLSYMGESLMIFSNSSGEFDYTFINCFGSTSASLTAYDVVGVAQSNEINFSITNGSADLGAIQACNGLNEFIEYKLDGQQHLIVDVSAFVYTDSTNNDLVTYIHSNSTSDSRIEMFFLNNNQTGTFLLDRLFVFPYELDMSKSTVSTTVTNVAPNTGDPIVGAFSGVFEDLSGNSHTITGTYRVIRE